MVNDENVGADLAAAERERRSALWALSALQPGDPAAMTLLQKLEPYARGVAQRMSIDPTSIFSPWLLHLLIVQAARSLLSTASQCHGVSGLTKRALVLPG